MTNRVLTIRVNLDTAPDALIDVLRTIETEVFEDWEGSPREVGNGEGYDWSVSRA